VVERGTVNPQVAGSNPAAGAKEKCLTLWSDVFFFLAKAEETPADEFYRRSQRKIPYGGRVFFFLAKAKKRPADVSSGFERRNVALSSVRRGRDFFTSAKRSCSF
jgi:hypothetical protein